MGGEEEGGAVYLLGFEGLGGVRVFYHLDGCMYDGNVAVSVILPRMGACRRWCDDCILRRGLAGGEIYILCIHLL